MAYITKEEVAEIRKALKVAYPKIKFSVRNENNCKVCVAIMQSSWDFEGILGGREYMTITHPSKDQLGGFCEVFEDMISIIKKAPTKAEGGREYYNNSDAMTDYFDTAFYYEVSIGKWNKPYVWLAETTEEYERGEIVELTTRHGNVEVQA